VEPRYAIITSFLGKTRDRFSEYHEDRTIAEKLDLLSKIKGVSGIEIVYPYETPSPEELLLLLKKYNLEVAAINCNIKRESDFLSGSICSTNRATRKKAVDFIKGAKDYACSVKSDKVHCAPLNDGYDYIFQTDYTIAWKHLVEAFLEVSEYKPEIDLVIEYKESEPRAHCFVDSAAKALLLCREIGRTNVGVTIDFGHSLQRGETPAEELCLIAESGFPFYVHINDNNRKWDWDMITATHNFLGYVEFLFWLKQYDYKGFLSSDTAPCRLDISQTFEANIRITSKIWSLLENLNRSDFRKLIASGDYIKVLRKIEEDIYKL
jgi:xylose isomerase